MSGNLATHALLAKNDALVMLIKASDTWNKYQSKSIKIHLLEGWNQFGPKVWIQEQACAANEERPE